MQRKSNFWDYDLIGEAMQAMTTKQAENKFGFSRSQIRMLCKENLIPDSKKLPTARWDIPDDLKIILSKDNINLVLEEILKIKNFGENYPINRSVFPDQEKCECVMDYLYRLGMIGEYNINLGLNSIQLTDRGFQMLFNNGTMKTNSSCTVDFHFSLAENINGQIGVSNIQSGKLATVG